ncbi:hypothetical protein M409DRAFT_19266 [Zasmidium cellare ATCC 36951]|uniref:DJ-1/PfpI domain-containing protein n=1 Tax=Zasmidium cellare ATCC 36951 TaxID=1080233 RepID=A0A6A6CTG9_ZASCE|nr:uncharacterized protein M409DRAFT_19266 [Zasmidium cellare ATCC 36951]KAF2170444.1 hypothetical protein M409DRAFT_19266 [Zasmidium cellare ATCC 36951]
MPPSTYAPNALQTVIIAWTGMDLTDFAGPVEVLSHARNDQRERLYNLTIAAETDESETSQNVSIHRHTGIEELVQNIDKYDVLILPGGGGFTADTVPDVPGLKNVMKAFTALQPRESNPRVLLTICAGVFFLAEAGLLVNKVATSHYFSLRDLQKLCDRHGETKIVRQHYVDVGDVGGTRVVVSGGITSGFDATLYLVEMQQGLGVAEKARAVLDAGWRREALPFGTF